MNYNFDKVINRKGTYSTQWDYIEDRFGEKDLLPFSISDTDFEVPSVVIDDLEICLHHKIFGYTRWNHDNYKNAIVHHYKERMQTYINKEWVAYSPSVMYSVSVLINMLSLPKDGVLVFNPMYDAFINVICENRRTLISCALDKDNGFTINFADFESKLKQCKIFLLCSPHNPSGRVFTQEELTKMILLCKKYDVYIISDEIHSDVVLYENKHYPILNHLSLYKNVILVSSSSKTFNTPALGGSYLIIPDSKKYDDFLRITRKKDFVNSANIMGMIATMSAYNKTDTYIDELICYIEKNMECVKKFVDDELPDVIFEIPQATYLAWLDMRNVPFTSEQIQKALVNIGKVGIMAGEVYGENGIKFLRMNLGCPRSKIVIGLERFKIAMVALYEGKIC